MEKNKTTDQNPELKPNPEENTETVAETTDAEKETNPVEEVEAALEKEQNTDALAEEPKAEKEVEVDKNTEVEVLESEAIEQAEVAEKEKEDTSDTPEEKPIAISESAVEDSDQAEAADELPVDEEAKAEKVTEEDEPVDDNKVDPVEEVQIEPVEEVKEKPAEKDKDEPAEEDKDKPAEEDKDEPAEEDQDEDNEHEDEDDEGDEEHEEDDDEAFEEYSDKELVGRLEELVQSEDISTIKTKIALVKVAFMRILKEKKLEALDKFIEEGGKKEDFSYEESNVEKRFNKAFDLYRKNKIKYNELQEKLKIENLEKKKTILEQLKELISSEETLKKTYDQFRALQDEWKEVGMVPSGEVSNLWQSYHFLVEKFFDKVKINKELRDLDMKKNLELKVELCEKTEELLLETSIIKSFKQLQQYHQEWKDIGPVPQEQNDEIWERFKAATDKINERRREHYGKLQEEQENNLLAKTDLCEKAEELLAVTPESFKEWQLQTNKMNELFKLWRSIGRAPKKQNNEVWDRFKGSMNTFYNNKKEFMKTIKNEQLNNYNLKVDLCVQAENLKESTDWKKTTQELIRLQNDWKKIGPVPRKHSDKIWKRFRAACDDFFSKKSEHFSGIHEKENDNLEKKKELIESVRKHAFGKDKSKNLDILKNFQREWMEIGYVPMKEKEKVQKQFRAAIDDRLEELKISSTELSNASYATRMEAVKDSPDASRVYRKEISFLNNKIVKLREDVNLWENNLGFFANSKKADLLKQEFEQKIEKAKQELAGMEAKVKYLRKMATEE